MSCASKRVGLSFFLLCVLFASCSTMRLPVEAAQIRPDAFGLAHAGASESEYPLIEELGASWVRQTFRWDKLCPSPGIWHFDYFDSIVNGAASHGKKLVVVLGYDVGWMYKSGKSERDITADLLPVYLEYVRTVVTRYRGRVGAWEIWNEPNWVFWKGSDSTFYELALQTAALVKTLDPATPILVGATFRTDEPFITGLYDKGVFAYADALSIHPYANDPVSVDKQIAGARSLLNRLGIGGKELWITEIGYPNYGFYPNRVNPDLFADYVLKTLVAATAEKANVIVWYEHFDSGRHFKGHLDFDSSGSFGLRYKDGSLKEGARAFLSFTTRVAGTTYDPGIVHVDPSLGDIIAAAYRNKLNGHTTLVIWRNHGGAAPVCVEVSSGYVDAVYPDSLKAPLDIHSQEWRGAVGTRAVVLEALLPEGALIRIGMGTGTEK